MIRLRFPGKLFLMGEYAVMETDYPAVVAAIDRFMYISIETHETYRVISSKGLLEGNAVFSDNKAMPHVSAAVRMVQRYLRHAGQSLQLFSIMIESELETRDKKYGLGSSGVVVCAVISALLSFHGIELSALQRFKLAVLVQMDMQEISSGGDLAAALYGGVIHYQRYDETWLQEQDTHNLDVMDKTWPGLVIESLPFHYQLLAGWTQSENKTLSYLKVVKQQMQHDEAYYRKFQNNALVCVREFIRALQEDDDTAMQQAVNGYRLLMKELGSWSHLLIETPALETLIETALQQGVCAKISGSGGGDCGIAFLSDKTVKNGMKIVSEWEKHGILYLDVKVWDY